MLPPYSLVTPRLIAAFIVLRRNGSNHPYAFYSTFVVLSFLHLLKIATFAKALLHQGSCAGSLCLADEVGAAFYSTSVMPRGMFTHAPLSFLYSARMYFFVGAGW